MKNISQKISQHKSALSEHPFCLYLRETDDISEVSLRFVPAMTFFVLGFRDILESIRVDNPKTALEKMVNNHCDEDSEHWHWFIEDLDTLGMDTDYWGGSVSAILYSLWSPDQYIVRDLVYRVIHHVHASRSVHEKLIVIECLEAAFAAFIESLNQLTQKAGMYKKLRYFGRNHYEQEADHTMGSWIDEKKASSDAIDIHMYDIRQKHMLGVVADIFSGFNQVFSCWHASFKGQIITHTAATLSQKRRSREAQI